MQNDNAKFKNHSDFVGIPKFCTLIFTFCIVSILSFFRKIKKTRKSWLM